MSVCYKAGHSRCKQWAMVGALALGMLAPISSFAAPADQITPNATVNPQSRQAAVDLQEVFENIARTIDPAVVHIDASIEVAGDTAQPTQPFPGFPGIPGFPGPRNQQPQSQLTPVSGSGIIVDPNGVIITNRHVVEGAKKATVTLTDHRIFSGTVYQDPNIDIAVIKIDATDLPYAKLTDSSNVRIGAWAIAIGYPFDVGETMSVGVVSALNRSQQIGPESQYYPNLIQTDASINPGNSGGALVDINGNVIGINTAIYSTVGGEQGQSAGIGFAIPSNAAAVVWPQLANPPHKIVNFPPGWKRGRLGVEVGAITPNLFNLLGVQQGALVMSVQPDSPAAKAGIQAGDVITKVNGIPVLDSQQLVDTISDIGPNQSAVLTVLRNKHTLTRTVITGSFGETATASTNSQTQDLGLTTANLTPDMMHQLKLPAGVTDGAVVTGVEGGSPADAAGFQQGDVIYQVNDTPIHNATDYTNAVAAAKPGDSVGVKVYRNGTTQFLIMQVPEKGNQ